MQAIANEYKKKIDEAKQKIDPKNLNYYALKILKMNTMSH